ncbi:MAG: polyprenyl synthetase family protein [Lewinella sp.]|uniref:polyprenyl synthetase family protein n=1 Tax=Lewinella sp. TaxID=2004506 RepID=UPI003D6AD183
MQNINTLQQLFNQYLLDNHIDKEPKALYEPFNYIMNIGGKRMRPVMALLACYLFEEEVEKALPVALSVEVFHNFSLVHDDIMDEAPLRRGQATVHSKYGLNSGILSGDVMLIFAYDYLRHSPRQQAIAQLYQTLSEVAIQVCEGQQYDIDFEQRDDVRLEEYLQMIEMKTAALLAGSLKMGAIAAGADPEDQKHLSEFGRLTGIAFQIQDDFLDTFGDPQKVGKRVGGDIVQNKKTCLIIKALELATPEVRERLLHLYAQQTGNEQEKVATVTNIFVELGIPEFLRNLRNDYQKRAYQHLEQVNAPKEKKDILFGLAESLLVREL